MIAKKIAVAVISGVVHFMMAGGVFWSATHMSGGVYYVLTLVSDLVFGVALGFVADEAQTQKILIAATVGALVAFLPVILTSYGLALLMAPYILGNLMLVYLGLLASRKLQAPRTRREFPL